MPLFKPGQYSRSECPSKTLSYHCIQPKTSVAYVHPGWTWGSREFCDWWVWWCIAQFPYPRVWWIGRRRRLKISCRRLWNPAHEHPILICFTQLSAIKKYLVVATISSKHTTFSVGFPNFNFSIHWPRENKMARGREELYSSHALNNCLITRTIFQTIIQFNLNSIKNFFSFIIPNWSFWSSYDL